MQNIIIQTRQHLWGRCINKSVRDFHSINNTWHYRQSLCVTLQFLQQSSKNRYFGSKDDVPTFQDTEVPLYSFLDKESFNIDNDIKFEQQQNKQQSPPPSISKMLSILIPESKSLLTAVGALTMATVCTMQFPNAIGEVIDILNTGSSININDVDTQDAQQAQIQSIALQLTGYFTIGSIATFVHTSMFDMTGQKIGANLRKELFSKLIHRNVAFFDRNRAGELANRLSTDVHEVAEHLVQNIELFLSNFVRALTASAQMIVISPVLTMYLSPLPIMMWGCTTFYGKFIKHWSKQHLNSLAQSTHVATERFGGHRTMVSFGQRDMEQKRYSGIIEAAYLYSRRVAMFQGSFLGSSYLIGNGSLVLVLAVGSFQVLDGNISAGNLAGFCMYCGHLTESVLELSSATGGFLKAQGSGARLFNLLDNGPAKDNNDIEKESSLTLPPSYNASIKFEDVEFAYPSHSNILVLNKVSFTLNDGQILGITAPSGSGKSSIINLIMRFYEPTSGKITLDETDIKELDEDWLRSQIALVQQEPILFHASVYENVAYGKPNATTEEVIKACIAANANEFIMDMPEGYDSIVGERGASISGGQKQRLCIARALLMKPKILCLDESSSALDSLTEKDFLHRLRELVNSEDNNLSAVIFMTHKQSVLQACDRVAVLTDGKIQEVENNALAGLLM